MPESLRVGLLGAGYIAPYHLRALRGIENARVVAVCDTSGDRAAELARNEIGVAEHRSLDEMLEQERLDVVHVLLPPPLHAEAGEQCLASGTHVLLEKPIATSTAAARALCACAERAGRRVGTSHNFLFTPAYEKLRRDLANRALGRPEQIEIIWRKPLAQLTSGPFGGWLFANPTNVMFEVAPHAFAHLIDLVGEPERVDVVIGNPVTLHGGRVFYRWWDIIAEAGRTRALVRLSFGGGYSEHSIHVRSASASASVDFERNHYRRLEHGTLSLDVDRFAADVRESGSVAVQAAKTLADLARAKLGFGGAEPFGGSIAAAVGAYYSTLDSGLDPRLDSKLATQVVALAERVVEASGKRGAAVPRGAPRDRPSTAPTVLVIGGAGFIGRALVAQLAGTGKGVRVLSRGADPRAPELAHPAVELLIGDLADASVVDKALSGISTVYHLARGRGATRADFERTDVAPTRALGQACLRHGIGRLIYASSTVIFNAGPRAGPVEDDSPPDPAILEYNAYAGAKADCEAALSELRATQGLPLVIARPAIVIGRGSEPFHFGIGNWPHPFVCVTWGSGRTLLPLVLVRDVADALVRCMDTPGIEGKSFNLAGPPLLTAREYLAALEQAAGVRVRQRSAAPLETHLADTAKWILRTLAGLPGRPRPRLRIARARTAAALIPCRNACTLLGWTPCANRDQLIEEGIRAPLLEFLG